VYGFEGDASYSPSGEFHLSTGDTNTTNDFSVTDGVNTLFTLRPRAGVAVDKLLLFATGGLAVGQASFATQAHVADSGKGLASADWSGQNSAWRTGFTFGGGAEYAVTPKMRLKFEALYYDLGTIDVAANGSGISTARAPPHRPVLYWHAEATRDDRTRGRQRRLLVVKRSTRKKGRPEDGPFCFCPGLEPTQPRW
jgi:opacity protein-like surface antigen